MNWSDEARPFDGPIDVLLQLVSTSEVDIYEISLSEIVTAFCEGAEQTTDLDQKTKFLLPAAILVELKSKRLLPVVAKELTFEDMEEELAFYAASDLSLARLIEGHTFSVAARRLRELVTAAAQHHPRQVGPDERFADAAPDPLESVTADDLAAALREALSRPLPPELDITHIAVPPKTVEECANELVKRLQSCGHISFKELTEHIRERVVVVAHFLALLELFRLGHVELTQAERFGDIEVLWVSTADEVSFSEFVFAA